PLQCPRHQQEWRPEDEVVQTRKGKASAQAQSDEAEHMPDLVRQTEQFRRRLRPEYCEQDNGQAQQKHQSRAVTHKKSQHGSAQDKQGFLASHYTIPTKSPAVCRNSFTGQTRFRPTSSVAHPVLATDRVVTVRNPAS